MASCKTIGFVVVLLLVGGLFVALLRPPGDSDEDMFRQMLAAERTSRLLRPVDRRFGTSFADRFRMKADRHKAELFKRGYLETRTFRFFPKVPSVQALESATCQMLTNGWCEYYWALGRTPSIRVTAPRIRLPAWEAMVRRLGEGQDPDPSKSGRRED